MHRLRYVVLAAVVSGDVTAAAQQPRDSLLISTSELAARLNDPDVVLLHVADERATYEQAHISGARFLRYGDVAVDGDDELGAELPPIADLERVFEEAGVSDTSRVVIYGNTVAAARVFFTLDAAGHRRVAMLDGGLPAWRAEDRDVVTGVQRTSGAKGSFTPRVIVQRMATADWIRTQGPRITLVDVRPDPEYTGSDGGMGGAHAAGHIDGARQLTWGSLVGLDGISSGRRTSGEADKRRCDAGQARRVVLHDRYASQRRVLRRAASRPRRAALRRIDRRLDSAAPADEDGAMTENG